MVGVLDIQLYKLNCFLCPGRNATTSLVAVLERCVFFIVVGGESSDSLSLSSIGVPFSVSFNDFGSKGLESSFDNVSKGSARDST